MNTLALIIQVVVALGIINVWIFRFKKETEWRGQNAKNMAEEFSVYGLPAWSVGVVGFLKLISAGLLIIGIWIPSVVPPAAFTIAALMLGAILMHVKVKDPLKKSLPAVSLLILSLFVALA